VTNPLDQFRAALATYASQDSPPALLMRCLAEVCDELKAAQAQIKALPLAEGDERLLSAARKALLSVAPGVERVRLWQRWSAVVAASVVCLCAIASLWMTVVVSSPQPSVSVQKVECVTVNGGEGCWFWTWTKAPAGK
jgi:hypothetical protein